MPDKKIISLDELSRYNDKVSETYAKQNGYYETLTSGNADNLTPYGENSGAYDDTPFVFQTSGGSADIGNGAYLKELRGNSVAFNQLVQNGNFADGITGWSFNNGTYTISSGYINMTATAQNTSIRQNIDIISSHKYLFKANVKAVTGTWEMVDATGYSAITTTGDKVILFTGSSNQTLIIYGGYDQLNTTLSIGNIQIFDLTLMFGVGNEPTSVLEFNRLFPNAYYEYNAGELLSCKSNGYKIIGYNAFDGIWERGDVNNAGEELADNRFVRSDYIGVIAGQTYSLENIDFTFLTSAQRKIVQFDGNKQIIKSTTQFNTTGTAFDNPYNQTLENNCRYVRIVYYNASIQIPLDLKCAFHLTWDSSRTGYEPYESETYPLPNVELKSAGSVYDELKPDGTLIRRVGSYTFTGNESDNDIGISDTLTSGGLHKYYFFFADMKDGGENGGQGICDKYARDTEGFNGETKPCVRFGQNNRNVYFIISNELTTKAQVKSFFAGTTIYYELETPTEEQTTNTFQEITKIDDFGTQEFLSSASIVVPQGNYFFYPVDYKAFIDSLGGRADIEYDASEIVSQTQLSALDTIVYENLKGMLRHQLASAESVDFNNTLIIDLGTLTWGTPNSYGRATTTSSIPTPKLPSGSSVKAKMICPLYKTYTADQTYGSGGFDGISMEIDGKIDVKQSSFVGKTADQVKALLKGILLAYEKAS